MNNNKKTGWHFDNSYAELPKKFFSLTKPTPVKSPQLVIFNDSLAASLGLSQSEDDVAIIAGNRIPEGAKPLAQAYAGHQFGHFTMLGDGRAVLLGEQITPQGDRFDIQLKGSGRTPYSRGGDGRAALRPMLREYIISEAMHGLGIPTTRSLAVVTTGEMIMREKKLPGAILTRVATSHLRVGTFQYVANSRPVEELKILADYTIKRHFPEVADDVHPYLSLYEKVTERQAELISKWQLVGFIHGVMNTDNMALSGETIDYGPCAFMDVYDQDTVFSSIDQQGRYAYKNQPLIAGWNLARFAETLLPLFHDDMEKAVELAEEKLSHFNQMFQTHWLSGMRAKLGISNEEAEDQALIDDLLAMMEKYQADYTNTFIALTSDNLEDTELCLSPQFKEWKKRWDERLSRQGESKSDSFELMKKSNPALIPRNHLVEEALEAAVERGDDSVMKKLLEVLSNPYAHSDKQAEYATVPESTWPYQTFCGT